MSRENKKRELLFINLCESYHRKIVIYLYHLTGNQESANDLAQETFTILYEKIEKIVDHPNQAGFIYQTAKYVAANYQRRVYKQACLEEVLDENVLLKEEDVYEMWRAMEDEKIHEEKYIEEVLGSISEEKRMLYRLRYVEKKAYKEIAKDLGASEVSIRMKIMRLKKEVKTIIHEVLKESYI